MYWKRENMDPFYVKHRQNHHYEKPFGWSYRRLLRAIFMLICAINIVSLMCHIDLPSPKRSSPNDPETIITSEKSKSPLCLTPAVDETKVKSAEMNFEMKLQADINRQQQAAEDPFAYPRTNIKAYSIAGLLQMIGFAMNIIIRLRGLLAIGAFKGWDDSPSFTNSQYSDRRESFSGCIVFIGGMILLLGANSIGLFKVTLFDLLCHCLLTCLGIIFLVFSIDDNRTLNSKEQLSVPWRSTPDLSNCSLPTIPADDDLQQPSVALNMWPDAPSQTV